MHLVAPRIFASILALTQVALAAPVTAAPPAADNPKAFEAGYIEGQAALDRGAPLEAARIWLVASRYLPETTPNRSNRAALFEYIAEAFQQGLRGEAEIALLREAVTALDEYCDGYTRAYGTETPLSPTITQVRDALRIRLQAAGAAAPAPEPEPEPEPEPAPAPAPARPWKGLAIGGGALIGAGVGAGALAAAMGARGNTLEAEFDDPANACVLATPSAPCQDILDRGRTTNIVAITGVVAGTLLVGGGVALLVTGLRRRASAPAPQAIAPAFGPGFVGLTARRAF